MHGRIKPQADIRCGVYAHQVYVGDQMFTVFADNKKEARSIVEGWGHKVSFVTRMIG